MLSETYTWFTEGFDTADLKTAKMLIAELHDTLLAEPSAVGNSIRARASVRTPRDLTTATTVYREMDKRFWLEQAEVKALEG